MYIDDDYLTTQRHIINAKHSFENWASQGKIQYKYIVSNEQLIDNMLSGGGSDLGYPLRKEVKRDRFVLNSEAMRKAIQDATEIALSQMEKEIIDWLQKDLTVIVEQTATNALNNVVFDGMNFSSSGSKKQPQHWTSKLASRFGKVLGNAIWDAFEETVGGNKY